MTAQIKVWGYYDVSSRTPLLHAEEITVETYGEARDAAARKCRELGGKNAHAMCDGPNQNMNSIWISQ